ncbi:MAG: DUF1512 domain-containing protein [Nitrososphaerales archaeon]
MVFQIAGNESLGNPLAFLIFYLPIILFFLYGQKFQLWMMLNDISRALGKLKVMRDKGRKEVIDYISVMKPTFDPAERVDQFLEYFTIMPVDLDPAGIIKKLEHILLVRDERMRSEVKNLVPSADKVKTTVIENLLEVAGALNVIYKIVRHFYLLGKKTSSYVVIMQIQFLMPLILQEAEALVKALDSLKNSHPIGDGIGPLIVGRMMLNSEKRVIAKDTILSEIDHLGRKVYLIKAEGPGGMVGQIGTALEKLVSEMGIRFDAIIMIDAALKLEGEKSGEVAEGVGAAIGGIGVDRFKIEEVATRFNIPLFAIVIKQSIVEAISTMRREIAEASEKVRKIIDKMILEKTKEGSNVIVVGVGNTLGIAQ